MREPILIPIGEFRLLDISTVWFTERFKSQKPLHSEGEELPRYVCLHIIRFYTNLNDYKSYKMAYFLDEHLCDKYWKWILSILSEKAGYIPPPFQPFNKLPKEVSLLFFASSRTRKIQDKRSPAQQLADAREKLKSESPAPTAISEEEQKKLDLAQKRAQDNNQFYNNVFKGRRQPRKEYSVTTGDLTSDLDVVARAAAKHYRNKSKNRLPDPEEFGLGDKDDI